VRGKVSASDLQLAQGDIAAIRGKPSVVVKGEGTVLVAGAGTEKKPPVQGGAVYLEHAPKL